jgi:hypothetical protein
MNLITALINQGNTLQEATSLKEEITASFYQMLEDGEDPSEILYDYGLEPDYLEDLLF